ncbi:MAG: 2OG-Fe(II) oxygenase [Myxococcota bacterium]|nr:2OG-Fe(II) oxygenase [Myxococcota bacterium]
MSMIDLEALDAAQAEHDPFDYIVVPDLIRPAARETLEREYPKIPGPGNFALDAVEYGPTFAALLEELRKPEFARKLGAKLNAQLEGMPVSITVRGFSQATDGNIHNDHWTKIVSMLIYFNEGWPHDGGQLRMLRSPTDIEDYAGEVNPVSGTMAAFRRTENSFHGHRPFVGERRMIQMSWVRPSRRANLALRFKRVTTRLLKRLHLDPASNVKD